MTAPTPAPTRPSRLDRLLPPPLRGPSRRAAWNRARLRRAGAALLVALAAVLGLSALRPAQAPPGIPVLVAAHDLASGTRLSAADVRVAEWPARSRPPRTARTVEAALGRTVNAPVAAGEPLPASRLHASGVLAHLPADEVAVHVPLRDPATRHYLQPGDHVDALSAAGGRTVASDLLVLATGTPRPGAEPGTSLAAPSTGSTGAADAAGVLVAATAEQAASLAGTIAEDGPGAGVVLSIRPHR